jgi:membrane protein
MTRIERYLLRRRSVRWLLRISRKISLPGFEGLSLYDVSRFFLAQTRQVGLNERAAAISFNFLMAVPPFSIFIFTLLAHLPQSKDLYEEALILVRQITPDNNTYKLIRSLMDDFFVSGGSLLSFGLLLALYFSSNAMLTIMRTFNKSMLHIETERRGVFELRWVAIKLTLYIAILILGTTFVMVTQGKVTNMIIERLEIRETILNWMVQLVRLSITFLLVFGAISLIYRHAPAIGRKWNWLTPGALLATVLIIVFSIIFSAWVNNVAGYNRIYGSIGSILILMLLVYFNSLVLLIGFELNVSINSLRAVALRRHRMHENDKQPFTGLTTNHKLGPE